MKAFVKITSIVLAVAIASDIGISSAIAAAEDSEDCAKAPAKVFAKALNFSRKHRITPFSHKLVKKVRKKVYKKPCVDDKPAIVKPILPPAGNLPVTPAPVQSPVAATPKPLPDDSHIPGHTVIVPSQGFPIFTGYEPPRHVDRFYNFNIGLGWGFGGGMVFWPGYFVGNTYAPVNVPHVVTPVTAGQPDKPSEPVPVSAPSSILILLAGLVASLFHRQRGKR